MSSSVRERSRIQEKSVAKDLKGRVTVASGAKWFQKSDVLTEKYRVECKTTSKDRYVISSDVWEKIKDEALSSGLIPLLVVDLSDRERYVVFEQSDFFEDVYEEGTKHFQYTFRGCSDFLIVTLKHRRAYMRDHNLMAMPIAEFKEMEED